MTESNAKHVDNSILLNKERTVSRTKDIGSGACWRRRKIFRINPVHCIAEIENHFNTASRNDELTFSKTVGMGP